MNLENQVEWQLSNLELSKKLKELGVKQKSLYWWYKDHSEKKFTLGHYPPGFSIDGVWQGYRDRTPLSESFSEKEYNKPAPLYSAFTVAELGEKLPEGIKIKKDKRDKRFSQEYKYGELSISKVEKGWEVDYFEFDYGDMERLTDGIYAKTEADARAKMLIYLIENKLIKPT